MREFARSHVCACECVGVFSYVWMKMSASAKAVKFLPVVGLVDRFALVRPIVIGRKIPGVTFMRKKITSEYIIFWGRGDMQTDVSYISVVVGYNVLEIALIMDEK